MAIIARVTVTGSLATWRACRKCSNKETWSMATTPQSVFPIGPLLRETKNKWGRDKRLHQAGPDVKQILSFLKESRTGGCDLTASHPSRKKRAKNGPPPVWYCRCR